MRITSVSCSPPPGLELPLLSLLGQPLRSATSINVITTITDHSKMCTVLSQSCATNIYTQVRHSPLSTLGARKSIIKIQPTDMISDAPSVASN